MVKKFKWTIADSDSLAANPFITNTVSSNSSMVLGFASTNSGNYYYTSTDSLTSDDFAEEPGLFDPLVDLVNKVVECRYCSTTYVVPEAGKVECPGCGANAREKAVAKV